VERKYLGPLFQKTGLSKFSVHSATKFFRLKLYSFTVEQKLHGVEYVARVRFCEAVCSGEVDTLPAYFTDEAWFSFDGHANIQNNRPWLADNYKLIHQVPLCDTKIGVWCAINATKIIRPNFFSGTFKSESHITLHKALQYFIFKFECREEGIHALRGYYMVHTVNEDYRNGLHVKVDIL
jgi:hypothetical protein